VAALSSCLDARKHKGLWLVRIDDVDQGRVESGAATRIVKTLRRFGFEWDRTVLAQSDRLCYYKSALTILRDQQSTFPCACSRRDFLGNRYPGTCRRGLSGKKARSIRLITDNQQLCFNDKIHGITCQNLSREVGDFVLRRADGYFAYHLATVVDDADQGVTHIIRGYDLITSTPRQIYLQNLLGYKTPIYAHVPVITDSLGQKLSKQTRAHPVSPKEASRLLTAALRILGQNPDDKLRSATISEIWDWAISQWKLSSVPKKAAITLEKG